MELIAHHRAAAHRAGPAEDLRAAAFAALADAAERAYARTGFERSLTLAREALELAGAPLDRARALETIAYASFVTFDGLGAWESLREAADIVLAETPSDRARIAGICGFAVMIPTRAPGLMSVQPPADDVRPYLELGLACAGEGDSEALVRLLASQGYWDFGYGIDPADESGARGFAAAQRAREIAQRLERPDLELMTLDSLTSGLNIRGLYGHSEPIDNERLAIARTIRDPFEVGDSFYTAAWSALDVGHYAQILALAEEFESLDLELIPIGLLSLRVLAQVPLGRWDAALADQARLRALLGDRASRPPSMASGGHGGEALILRARDEHQAAEAVLAEVEAWTAAGQWPRLWATAPVAVALAREGDFERARRHLDSLLDNGVYRGRELEARCVLVAEQRTWDEAGAVVADAREHGGIARLEALPLHADRLEGRAALAAGDAEGAVAPLERAAAGFTGLAAAWEAAQAELSLGEALVALGRRDEAAAVLARAAQVFERLRVPRELARARELLGSLTIAN